MERESLDAHVRFGRGDLVEYSPRTEPHADRERMTARLRELGDNHTRLDRTEPALNDLPPGEVRDTTTPMAMMRTV